MEFDNSGVRSNVEIDVMTLTAYGLNKTGIYKPTNPKRLTFIMQDDENSNSDELPINQKTFIVAISVVSWTNYGIEQFFHIRLNSITFFRR